MGMVMIIIILIYEITISIQQSVSKISAQRRKTPTRKYGWSWSKHQLTRKDVKNDTRLSVNSVKPSRGMAWVVVAIWI